MSLSLENVVSMHTSQFAADKLIKTVGYLCGCAAVGYRRSFGDEHATAIGLQQIASKCSDIIMGLRFHGGYSGLLVEAENLKNLSFLGGWQDPKAKALLYGQSASLMFYYLCENAAYLGWTAPGWIGPKLKPYGGADHLSRMSCFGWASWCLLDMASTGVKLQEIARMETKIKKSWPFCEARSEALRLITKSKKGLWLNMLRSFCFFVPDVQWCLKPGSKWAIQPDWFVQGLCLVEWFPSVPHEGPGSEGFEGVGGNEARGSMMGGRAAKGGGEEMKQL
eukprot:gene2026-3190_t